MPEPPKKCALLIGVSHYGEGLPPLLATPQDVAALKRVLENPQMAEFDQVEILVDPDPVEIRLAIQRLYRQCAKDDLVLLYFSGHGITDDNNHLYFATRLTSKDDFEATAVPARFVQQQSMQCYARRQILILDCCYSGAFKDGWQTKAAGLDLRQELGGEGRVVLTSSTATQTSFQQESAELSLYTQYLVEGIETGAADADRDGKIFVRELHDYVKGKVQEAKPNMKPDILLDREGFDILLSKAPRGDRSLDFRRLVEESARGGDISTYRRETLRLRQREWGITEEAAEAIIISVLEPFRRRLANLERFKTALQEEVDQQFPLDPQLEDDLRDWQRQVLGLADEDVVGIWQQAIAGKAETSQPQTHSQPVAEPQQRQQTTPTPAPPRRQPADPETLPLPPVEFEVATVKVKAETQPGGFLGLGSKEVKTYSVDRSRQSAQGYREDLGNNTFLDMVLIPSGSFQMGANEYEGEQPVHTVALQPFLMGKYSITQAQWRAVAAFPKVQLELNAEPSHFKGDNRPVEQISWWEAVEFCDRLANQTKRAYRLPSEAEWEYACRAGTTTPFHFGETITTDLANYRGQDWEYQGKTYPGNYGGGPYGSFREETTEVGSFPANAFGLYDMHGNVWEWCADHWHDTYASAPIDGSAWVTDNNDAKRLLRGGSWIDVPAGCRFANRNRYAPGVRYDLIGFRVVLCPARWLP
ncbi:MAG: SUMF1/EgtB/PvdO family nonheme iron enzyme [Nodosilinea sp.]